MHRVLIYCFLLFALSFGSVYGASIAILNELPNINFSYVGTFDQDARTHVVQKGETLYSISVAYKVTVSDLKQWNNLTDNTIKIGQRLVIKGSTAAVLNIPVVNDSNTTHFVLPGETLYSLARQYGTTVAQLIEWNNLGEKGLLANTRIWVVEPTTGGAPPVANNSTTKPSSNTVPTSEPPVDQIDDEDDEDDNVTLPPVTSKKTESTEITESGQVDLMEDANEKRYLCWHRSAAIGSVIKVKSLANNKEVFVRVAGRLENAAQDVVLKISNLAAYRLGVDNPPFKAEVTYFK